MVKLVATLSSYGRRAVVVGGVADTICQRIGSSGSIKPTTRRNWKHLPQRATRPPLWPAGMAEGNRETFGPRNPVRGGASRPIVPRVARERWAVIKMPRPGEDRSDVGGVAQFNNIGPVPLCPLHDVLARLMFSSRADSFSPANRLHPHYQRADSIVPGAGSRSRIVYNNHHSFTYAASVA